jgi:hypothetical protein
MSSRILPRCVLKVDTDDSSGRIDIHTPPRTPNVTWPTSVYAPQLSSKLAIGIPSGSRDLGEIIRPNGALDMIRKQAHNEGLVVLRNEPIPPKLLIHFREPSILEVSTTLLVEL